MQYYVFLKTGSDKRFYV